MALRDLHPAITAIPVGLAFGAILERAGLGDAKVIRGQLVGRNWTVILVMFGAIVTAMLGLLWADALGLIALEAMATPPTDLGGQLLGAVIFGGGFGIAALCPGTACVSAASGRRDGVAAVVGVLAGTLATALLWPLFRGVVAAVPDERRLLATDLGLPVWFVATAIVMMAIGAVRLARLAHPAEARPKWWRLSTIETVGVTLAVAYAGVETRPAATPAHLEGVANEIVREADHVEALQLAQWIREGRRGLRILDVSESVDTADYVIPGAEIVPIEKLSSLEIGRDEFVVLYSEGGAHAAQAWVLMRMRGLTDVRVLKDGLAAWEDEVMSPLIAPGLSGADSTRQARQRELTIWFGGTPRTSGVPSAVPTGVSSKAPARRRRNTC
jgi:rhodanese-related sulfurtransferase